MITPHVRGRSRLARRLSWFVVATMVLAAIARAIHRRQCPRSVTGRSGRNAHRAGVPERVRRPGSGPLRGLRVAERQPVRLTQQQPVQFAQQQPHQLAKRDAQWLRLGNAQQQPVEHTDGSPSSTPTGSPSGTPTSTPTGSPSGDAQATILISKFDQREPELEDDSTLDGASFAVYMDDGDEVFDDILDTLVFGPAPTDGGTVETGPLNAGWYWIVETTVPDGYTGSDPILVELNVDDEVTCIWDAAGLVDCVGNDGENEVSSWTWVEVENTPEDPNESPTVRRSGRPERPRDHPAADGHRDRRERRRGEPGLWRLVILAMAGLIAAALLLTPARLLISTDERRR